jgi:L-cysteine S-thiosulfotransferase
MTSLGQITTGAAVAALGWVLLVPAAQAAGAPAGDVDAGKAIAMDRTKGNCIACHMIPGGQSPGTIGPALVAIPSRYPSFEKLHAQIADPTVANPSSAMPPFGKNRILTEKELNDVTAYIWSL